MNRSTVLFLAILALGALASGCASGGPSVDCMTRATRRGGLSRALRCAVKINPELVESIGQ